MSTTERTFVEQILINDMNIKEKHDNLYSFLFGEDSRGDLSYVNTKWHPKVRNEVQFFEREEKIY